MRRTISCAVVFSLLACVPLLPLLAEEPIATSVQEGDVVPFSGTLLNAEAVAQILAQREACEKECDLRVRQAVDRAQAYCDLRVGRAETVLEGQRERCDLMLSSRSDEIERLMTVAIQRDRQDNSNTWWFLGGVLVGTALTVLVVEIVGGD